MADFEQLKQKYQPVLDAITKAGARLMNLNLDGDQLYLKAMADTESSRDRIGDVIKKVDPTFADLKHDIEVKSGEQRYTVQSGDRLSRIAKHFYGDAQKFTVIAHANNIANPDLIKVGEELEIPAAPLFR